jgi:hypothetical protein
MDSQKIANTRCQTCRYWFERCCHALALIEGDDQQPTKCSHFIIEITPIADLLESARW